MSEIKYTSEIKVVLVDSMGSDASIGAAAKVLTPDQYREYEIACDEEEGKRGLTGLINYMMKHRHGSPFESGTLQFHIHAPIYVWREFHRHRIGFSYSEESARYKQLEPLFYIPDRERPMMKVDNWKPGRPKFLKIVNQVGEAAYNQLCKNLELSYRESYLRYEANLALGIDPGLARDCLPVGIYSSCWVTTNPRALMHFLSLRTHEETSQFVSYPLYEIEVVARQCESLFEENFPITHKAFCDNGRVGP